RTQEWRVIILHQTSRQLDDLWVDFFGQFEIARSHCRIERDAKRALMVFRDGKDCLKARFDERPAKLERAALVAGELSRCGTARRVERQGEDVEGVTEDLEAQPRAGCK